MMTFMAREAAEAPDVAARFLKQNGPALQELGSRLRRRPPPVIITAARGSSDHAAGYFKYLSEILAGTPCCSVGASVASIYGAELRVKDALCITVSQSGQSPDILALQDAAKNAGALTVALVNDAASPAAMNADICLPLHAGIEKSVAATKSCIAACVGGAAVMAHWLRDANLISAVERLPGHLAKAVPLDWTEAQDLIVSAQSIYVLGRGPMLPVAQEVALKLKETCACHAEAYSFAEVMHGPLELMAPGFPVVAFLPDDKSLPSNLLAIEKMRSMGARLLAIGVGGLAHVEAASPWLTPITLLQSAYACIENAAQRLGRDPDRPLRLQKVTETV
jgi:glutamine---fructose-6-phosphate transaminase (isomerizing)